MTPFWRSHALWPLATYVVAMGLLAGMHLDLAIAQRWFYDAAAGGWLGRHAFWAEDSDVFVGEVSTVNDDETDNVFIPPVGRFPVIDEDVAPYRLIVGDYKQLT